MQPLCLFKNNHNSNKKKRNLTLSDQIKNQIELITKEN